MLTVSNLSRAFASQTVFDAANWFVPAHARVGLVGANGSGKSTLLRMIAGQEEPDNGAIIVPRGTTVGYLPQEAVGLSGRSVLEEALDAFAGIRAVEQECRRLEEALGHTPADDPEHDALLAAYSDAREHWDTHGAYDLESRAYSVLSGLGFRAVDFTRDAGEFSGGWQMRLALAKLLLQQPDLLLLDEPTNHLDLEARNWLEEFLANYPFTVILVAHDRYFLDVAVDRITEVSRSKLTDYPTSYTRYLAQKAEDEARAIEAYRTQQEEIERIQAFISRFRYQASKAALVQSRVKQLEKIDRLPPPEGNAATIHFRLAPSARSGRIVLELEQASKRYDALTVYNGIDLSIERGRKVALVGPNGAGKSTLIKLLAGVEPLSGGSRKLGHSVQLGYFAQDQTNVLDPDKTVLEEITAAASYDTAAHVRDLLGAFLFRGDSVHKRTKVLSGGERNRLALAKLLVQPSNCLLLDEPTNHLDISAKEILLETLQQYTGTLVLVAHDRYLLDQLPEEIIEVGAGHATRHLGNYEDYLRAKAAEATGAIRPIPAAAVKATIVTKNPTTAPAQVDRANAKKSAKDSAQRERSLAQLERDIADKEKHLAELTTVINSSDFYTSHTNPQGVFSQYAQVKKDVETLYEKLERLERSAALG